MITGECSSLPASRRNLEAPSRSTADFHASGDTDIAATTASSAGDYDVVVVVGTIFCRTNF
ncbi:hypothetical protein MAR_020214 [Mya arenaria]|uniref:Uncharacterized protein n=1 Tax=Mya arenaria TaxID=6604 RepID=A0ABY7E4T1_MYAAR|nr:hypothetical protein MAR_020214 [Mya arenaria]